MDAQRAEGAAALAAKQAEVDAALAALEAQRQRVRRLGAVLERTVYRLHRRRRQAKLATLFAKAFKAWWVVGRACAAARWRSWEQ